MNTFYITGTRRALGKLLKEKYGCVEVIDWILNQPYRVKELCVQI